jgi:gliding motility-associated-like protein
MKQKLPLIILLIQVLLCAAVYGQVTFCNQGGGKFSVTPVTGCVGETIQVNNEVQGGQNVGYVFNFNKNQIDPPATRDVFLDPSHIYASAGTFTILQQGSLNGAGFTTCKDYVVKETRAPNGFLTLCENGVVRLTVPTDSIVRAYDQITVDWGDGPAQPWTLPVGKNLIVVHQYKVGSIPSVKITGSYNDGSCQKTTKTRTISGATTPPSLSNIRILSVEMAANGSAKIIYEGVEGISTEVLFDDGSGVFVSSKKGTSTGGPQTVIIEGLNPKTIYNFKLSSRNVCDNLVESKIVSSVVMQSAPTSLDEINSLLWKSYNNPSELIQYQVKRDSAVVYSTKELAYLDKEVQCGKIYKYTLVAIIQNDVRSYSAPIEVEPKSSVPEVISKASVTVSADNLIETKVELGGGGLTSSFDLIIERSVSGTSAWKQISAPDNHILTYQDKDVNTAKNSYCYRFTYSNACKLKSPLASEPVCSILLTAGAANVDWTAASPFTGGVASYDLIQMDEAGAVREETPKGLSTTHQASLQDETIKMFLVRAYSSSGNLVSYSNKVNFIRDAIILVPDAFTPNGDGWNEKFEVKSYFTETFSLSIFNRWGRLVFHTTNAGEGWDGVEKGLPAPAGYYTYKLDVQDVRGKKISKSGGLLLIR